MINHSVRVKSRIGTGMALVAGLVVGVIGGAAAPAYAVPHGAQASASTSKIVANPDSVMVNTKTTLTGSGFAVKKALKLSECSATHWVIPAKVCNTTNVVMVRTDANGGFKVKFTALVCPIPPGTAVRGFSRTCYVGVRRVTGKDTEALVPFARITVTGP